LASLAAAVMFERFMETGFTEKTNNRFAYEHYESWHQNKRRQLAQHSRKGEKTGPL
jgi:hypothetical protein